MPAAEEAGHHGLGNAGGKRRADGRIGCAAAVCEDLGTCCCGRRMAGCDGAPHSGCLFDALGEAAAEAAEAFEWEVEALVDAVATRDDECALPARESREFAVVEGDGEPGVRERHLDPAAAVRERPGERLPGIDWQLDH